MYYFSRKLSSLHFTEILMLMRTSLSAVIFFTIILLSCRTSKPTTGTMTMADQAPGNPAPVNYSEPSTWLLGYIDPVQFLKTPHSEWFEKGYDLYQPDQEILKKLLQRGNENLSIKIVLGTWCPDSRREVPRFQKILDLCNFPRDVVTYIGVDNTKNAPVGEYDKLGIERVPTFIFMINKIEAGRIIENPVASLEQDMLNILTRNDK